MINTGKSTCRRNNTSPITTVSNWPSLATVASMSSAFRLSWRTTSKCRALKRSTKFFASTSVPDLKANWDCVEKLGVGLTFSHYEHHLLTGLVVKQVDFEIKGFETLVQISCINIGARPGNCSNKKLYRFSFEVENNYQMQMYDHSTWLNSATERILHVYHHLSPICVLGWNDLLLIRTNRPRFLLFILYTYSPSLAEEAVALPPLL